MRRVLTGQFTVLAVLLCLQAAASMMALRRDPLDRFRAATVSGLVWVSLRRIEREVGSEAERPCRRGRCP